ncbi:GDSL esterase/lipase At1g29670-like [Humulus lupulus]|uniref:GDSL esterase/lipase At1g29670-like n=1 Tax=Humulus lupulus TaxID=3486 RepID=UPI002B404432|nr:GDSL esterase/lipase At1g29670-like [Humulus lupulus]
MAMLEVVVVVMMITTLVMASSSNNIYANAIKSEPQVPCFFIFGDSLADNGNNNQLLTLAKVNYEPYGIDSPDGPTGRFTNGRTTVDILAELLGFEKYIPAFGSLNSSSNLMSGVNYASGAAGILSLSGKHMGDNIGLRKQVRNHRVLVSKIIETQRDKGLAKKYLNKCLYWVAMGNNDYINNYFMPWIYPYGNLYNPDQFADLLIQKYSSQIMKLYNNGARMVALSGLGQIGCTPNSISTYGATNGSTCVDYMNEAVQFFNKKLVTLVDKFNNDFVDAKFIYINSYGMGSGDPTQAGFKVWDVGCCSVNEVGQCKKLEKPCENRTEYVFWDSHHPTEASNLITAARIFKAYDSSDSYPMDLSSLIQSFGPKPY